MKKTTTTIFILLSASLFLHSCKGSGSRVDLAKKSEKCSGVYEEDVLPFLQEREKLMGAFTTTFQVFQDSLSDQRENLYCSQILKNISASRAGAILKRNECLKFAINSLSQYGGCAQFDDEIGTYCTLDSYPEGVPHLISDWESMPLKSMEEIEVMCNSKASATGVDPLAE